MSKTKTSTPTEITDDETNAIDSNTGEGATPPKSNAAGKDPSEVGMTEADDGIENVMTPQEQANADFMSDMTDYKDETDDEDFVEGAKAPEVKKPVATTPAGEVVQAAGKTPAQSELEASNVAKGLNPDGTAKEPTPQAPIPPTTPELNADGTPKVAAPVQPTTPTTPTQTEPSTTPEAQPTPEQITEYYQGWRKNTEDVLAKTHYRLSQEQVDELDTNPVEMLPKVMAKVYLDAVTATLAQVASNFPRMVNEVLERNKVGDSREELFYQAWPDLKGEAKTVLRIAGAYRQMNPGATTDDFIREVGAQAMVTLRKPIPGMTANGAGEIQVPAKPFKPAAATPPSTGAAPPPKNPFEALNDSFDEDFDTD